jgi:hypothetical protein
MNPEGYPAFVAWCVSRDIEPMSEDLYNSWSPQRFQRYLKNAIEWRDSMKVSHPTLF